ncbi:MAG TPA: HNH endonuclease domain-containing protein, partial [Euzebyales bacterium]|nr:HNH endonuclease domain-containing protein [Euzebyales bacterium]
KVGSGGRAIEQRFIYTYTWDEGVAAGRVHDPTFDDAMHLVDGAGEHLIALAGLLRPVVQREWLAFVAKRNHADVDELRLQEFLFGGDRIGLRELVDPLRELQRGTCFYCRESGGSWDVDHFLPWSRWPDNTLDNLVLAHRRCNNDKRAALPGLGHLDGWWQRFRDVSEVAELMRQVADATGWPRRARATRSAAGALYLRQPARAALWVAPGVIEELDHDRLRAIMRGPDLGLAAEDRGDFRP